MAKKTFIVPVYRTVVQCGTIKVLASDEKEALKLAKKQENIEVIVSDWAFVKTENSISFPEQPYAGE